MQPAPMRRDHAATLVKRGVYRMLFAKHSGLVIALILVCIYFGVTQPVFATWGNLTNIVEGNSTVLILAIGATFVILIGQIDLSATAALAASGVIMGLALESGVGTVPAVCIAIAVGVAIGLVNGALIAGAKISFLVVTLGMMSILGSIALILSSGNTISVFGSPGFQPIAGFVNNAIGPFSVLLLFNVALVLAAHVVLRQTRFGRSVFAVGSNVEAARLSGLNVSLVVVSVYVIAGGCAGLAGIVQVGRLTGASPSVDISQLMTVIAAVLIGGTAFSGGEGSVLGTVIGVAFLSVVRNGVTLSEVSSFWQGAISGSILIAAVGLGTLRNRRRWRSPRTSDESTYVDSAATSDVAQQSP